MTHDRALVLAAPREKVGWSPGMALRFGERYYRLAAINAGSHVAPTFGGDTIYAWSEVLEKAPLPGRADVGALRMRSIAAKDCPCGEWPGKGADGKYHPSVVLDLDYWVLMPRQTRARR